MSLLQVSAATYGQRVTISEKNIPLKKVFKEIRSQTGYDFMYDASLIKSTMTVDVDLQNVSLSNALFACLDGQNLTFEIRDKSIIIKPKSLVNVVLMQQQLVISGVILDENTNPIPGASIRIKGLTSRATVSNKEGRFVIIPASDNDVLVISYIGYVTKEVKVKGIKSPITVKLDIAQNDMKDVVITGTGITRNKNSFTGATAFFTQDQLKSVGNNNIIQSLRTLDPSFILMENNLAGANPNVLPQIEVRGKTSIPNTNTLKDQFATDPNQPLFILDGFETTLQNVVDLDMNRVGSVSILKDAASTALYGARASNGVVVIETIRPTAGKLRFTYSNDFRIESPDLSGYNMMNAEEKLEFERLSGRYIYTSGGSPSADIFLSQLYNTHLAAVKQGVNTYWLNEPVQTGISENNSIFAQGGDEAFTYGIGLNYKSQSGAMKGSGRNTWSGSINLTYRKNKLNINNVTYIRGYSATESPYGSFANFVNANPYYVKDPTQRYLEISRTAQYSIELKVRNPLYDASLPNTNTTENLEVQNNFQLSYKFNNNLELRGALQLIKGSATNEIFLAPENSAFEEVSIFQKGKYSNTKNDNFSYQANTLLTYGKVFGDKHAVTANARFEVNNNQTQRLGFSAEGFPEGSLGNPRFAFGYVANSAPSAISNTYRTASATASVNYAYDQRFLFDSSYRLDGSTAFGKNKQFSPYWSSGIGWNLHREKFMKNLAWLDRFKLFANIGITGNQNYGSITSVSVYNYSSGTSFNQFGQGVTLATLGNPDLNPQKTRQLSVGIDYSIFKGRLTGYINAYNKRTDPLVVMVDLPSSTGLVGYPLNTGNLNTNGAEARIGFSPIYRPADRVVWTISVTGSTYKSKYNGFGNSLNALNKQQELSKALLRFKDGYSPDDIWAAKSLGIDPGSGREIFLAADGQYTFDYNIGNVQAVGNTTPAVEGVFSNNIYYKGFNLGINLRYSIGGDIFNTALFNKVENISYTNIANNQDRRALYDRWKKPGDIAQFKGISQTSTTPASSRFVQRENMITGESLNIGYTFDRSLWLKKMGLQTVNLSALTNDIFRISTINRERGIDYPFAKTVSFSLRASF